jgi:hypothetical protein
MTTWSSSIALACVSACAPPPTVGDGPVHPVGGGSPCGGVWDGFTVRGQVVDAEGHAIDRATVTITSWRSDTNQARMTGPDGTYRFEHLDGSGPQVIQAAGPSRGRSYPMDVLIAPRIPGSAAEVTIDLVVRPTGSVDGTITGMLDGARVSLEPARGSVQGPSSPLHVKIDARGGFHFDDVPIGDYDVRFTVFARTLEGQRVSVIAGDHVNVALISPITPVAIQVHVTGQPCTSVELRSVTGDLTRPPIASQKCVGDFAELTNVTPGAYRMCAGTTCQSIKVTTPFRYELRAVVRPH